MNEEQYYDAKIAIFIIQNPRIFSLDAIKNATTCIEELFVGDKH